jgi:biotin-independent malonate decarboxylase gamma subunit
MIQQERVRYLSVVPDPNNRFPRARHGEVGIDECWALARSIREALKSDDDENRRALIALVAQPSQAYGRREEVLGLHLAISAATDAYASARLAGHPLIALIVGHAQSGGLLAHGYQANRVLALDDPKVTVHAMGKEAAARVTRRSLPEMEQLAAHVLPLAYDIRTYAQLGILDTLIEGVNADEPDANDIKRVQDALLSAIIDARSGPRDLRNRWTSPNAQLHRKASIEVRKRMAETWN